MICSFYDLEWNVDPPVDQDKSQDSVKSGLTIESLQLFLDHYYTNAVVNVFL